MNIIVDSKFDPYSYEELMRPILNYDTAYRLLEDLYNTLATTAAALDSVSGEYSRRVIDNYRDQLNKATDSFNLGMSFKDRLNLRLLKRHFATNVTPVVAAEESRKKFVEERNKILMSAMSNGDTIKFKNDNLTTDDFLLGKTPSNEYLSYNKIVLETATKSAALALSLLTNDVIKKSLLMPGTFEITKNNGITPEILFSIIGSTYDQLDSRSKEIALNFVNLYKETKDKYLDWGPDAKATVDSALNTGLYAALNKPQTTYERDPSYARPIDWAQYNLAKAREDRENKLWNIAMGIDPIYTDDNGIKYYTTPTGGVIPKKDGKVVDMSADDIKKALSGVKIDGLAIGGKRDSSEDKKEEEAIEKAQAEEDLLVHAFGDKIYSALGIGDKQVPNFAFKFRLDDWDDDLIDFRIDDNNTHEYDEGKVLEYIKLSDMKESEAKNSLIRHLSLSIFQEVYNKLPKYLKEQFLDILKHIIIGIKRNSYVNDDGYVLFDYSLDEDLINDLLGNNSPTSNIDEAPQYPLGNSSAPNDSTSTSNSGKTIQLGKK